MKKRLALLCNETSEKNFFNLLDIYPKRQFKEPPNNCINCESSDIIQLEILGIERPAMFWECNKCGKKHMKYSKSYTYKLLKTLNDFYINPDDFVAIQTKEKN
jgi:ribosomal protein L37AE/L43A